MRIIAGTEPIDVEHPVFLIFGQPGIGKSSLGYSANEPALLDADRGAHRAANRRDTITVDCWADINELAERAEAIAKYHTIVPDTVGRVLDFLALQLMEENPKYDRGGGALSLQGFGALKARFQTWLMRVRALGKDVVLLAHQKEDKDGDSIIVRPDVTGGSYGELMKVADFVGYVYMRGKDRVLDFNPTDRWVGKNPAQWKPILLPPVEKATHVMADLMVKGREALGQISAASAKVSQQVDDWRSQIDTFTTPNECSQAVEDLAALPAIVAPQVKKLLWDRSKALGFTFDTKTKLFVDPNSGKQTKRGANGEELTAADIPF